MGISKRRLVKIKADAFAILAAPSALSGAKSNAANVLRLAGVHELDIERALSPAEYAEPEPELSPGLGEAVAADLASRLTKLEARLGAISGLETAHAGDVTELFGRLGSLEKAGGAHLALCTEGGADLGRKLRALEACRNADGLEIGKALAAERVRVGELENRLERLEGRSSALEACVDMGRESRAELEGRVEELEGLNAEAFRARLDGGLETVKRPGVMSIHEGSAGWGGGGMVVTEPVGECVIGGAPIDCRGSGDPVDVSGWTNASDLDLEPGASS